MGRKIFTAIAIISVVLFGTLKLSSAFFSDTETSSNNVLAAGSLDLKVDNESYYNGVFSPQTSWDSKDLDKDTLFFNFPDLKPSDWGEDTISLTVEDNEAWACVDINLTSNDDATCTEPESIDDPNCIDSDLELFDGELAENINMIFWVDDGDNVLEDNEFTNNVIASGSAQSVLTDAAWVLADSSDNNIGGNPGYGLTGAATYYIGKAWCFGTLTPSPLAQDGQNNLVSPANTNGGILCDGSALNNATQTDILTGDITFRAYQHRNNPDFTCVPPPVISCTDQDIQFASSASNNDQGLRKNNTAVAADRSVESHMFGSPQTLGNPSDSVTPNSFFSLGFPLNGNTASIVLGFSEPFYNGPTSEDLLVYEVTGGTYPDEKIKIEASKDGSTWTLLAAAAIRDEAVDLGPLDFANFIRLTDVSDINLFESTADGYDVDAVKTFCRAEI